MLCWRARPGRTALDKGRGVADLSAAMGSTGRTRAFCAISRALVTLVCHFVELLCIFLLCMTCAYGVQALGRKHEEQGVQDHPPGTVPLLPGGPVALAEAERLLEAMELAHVSVTQHAAGRDMCS